MNDSAPRIFQDCLQPIPPERIEAIADTKPLRKVPSDCREPARRGRRKTLGFSVKQPRKLMARLGRLENGPKPVKVSEQKIKRYECRDWPDDSGVMRGTMFESKQGKYVLFSTLTRVESERDRYREALEQISRQIAGSVGDWADWRKKLAASALHHARQTNRRGDTA